MCIPTPRAVGTMIVHQASQVRPLKFDFGEPESGKYYSPAFISYKKIRVFQAVLANKQFQMPILEALPHNKFGLGHKNGLLGLNVAVDTCTTVSLAYKGDHKKIAQQL
jgi:hypothetical protein